MWVEIKRAGVRLSIGDFRERWITEAKAAYPSRYGVRGARRDVEMLAVGYGPVPGG